jgi:hypothetical protein
MKSAKKVFTQLSCRINAAAELFNEIATGR